MGNDLSKAERTRQFIIESTADLFNKKGFAGTSISDLTAATGLSKGAIYGNFGNKEGVAKAAFEYNRSKLRNLIQKEVMSAATYKEKLLAYAVAYKRLIRSSPVKGGCPILNTAIDSDDDNTFLRPALQSALETWEQDIIDLLRAGVRAGEFRKNDRQHRFAVSMIALIEGGVMLARASGDQAKMDLVIETLEELIGLQER